MIPFLMSQVFVPAYLIAAGPFVVPVLIIMLGALCWLALWLLGKGGWWRVPGLLIALYLGAVALAAVGLIK